MACAWARAIIRISWGHPECGQPYSHGSPPRIRSASSSAAGRSSLATLLSALAQELIHPGRGRVVGGADLGNEPGPELVQLAPPGVYLVHGGVRALARAHVGRAVIAGHPLGQRDAQYAVVALVAETAGVVADCP